MALTWDDAQNSLKLSMQREIHMMREILANMHQEELFLLMNDREGWTKIMQERSDMVSQLKYLRIERLKATENLKQLARSKINQMKISLDDMLPMQEENSGEIRSLLDQIFALIERINLQNCRNEFLFYNPKEQSQPLHCSYPPPYTKLQKKSARKTSVTTCTRKKNV